jgi:hypothetical protein
VDIVALGCPVDVVALGCPVDVVSFSGPMVRSRVDEVMVGRESLECSLSMGVYLPK